MSNPTSIPPSSESGGPSPDYKQKPTLYQRVTKSVPLLITVIVHVVVFLIAGAFVIKQEISPENKFEATPPAGPPDQSNEHRLQMAHRDAASGGSSSPVSQTHITTSAESALQLPEMPSLPNISGGPAGFGPLGPTVITTNTNKEMTLQPRDNMGNTGFVSDSFLIPTSQIIRKLVFIVDVNKNTMSEGSGGFEAFGVIRQEIMRLIASMPPSAQFNVILFDGEDRDHNVQVNLFAETLLPANVLNKDAFILWLQPVNSAIDKLGLSSAGGRRGWKPGALPENSGITGEFDPVTWSKAVRCALEMQPDTIVVITNTRGNPTNVIGETEWMRRMSSYENELKEYQRYLDQNKLDEDAIAKARNAAYSQAKREFDAANKAIVAKGHPPIIITHQTQVFDSAVQARLKKEGFNITLDKTGWSDKNGNAYRNPPNKPNRISNADWADQIIYVSRLQRALVPTRAMLNIFLFTGTTTPKDSDSKDLSDITRRFGGKFEVLTNQRLLELRAKAETGGK